MGISRIIKKFEKVKKAVNSIKGIQSKIQSINYTTALDSLGESQEAAEAILSTRRDNLQGALGAHKRVGMAIWLKHMVFFVTQTSTLENSRDFCVVKSWPTLVMPVPEYRNFSSENTAGI